MDDAPMGLYATEAEARAKAKRMAEKNVIAAVQNVMDSNASQALHIGLLEFRNGDPCGIVNIRDFEAEAAAA